MATFDRKSGLRMAIFVSLVLLMSNLGALVDLVLHPEIPYFDEEHLFVGGVTAITVILLLGSLEKYLDRRRNIDATLRKSEERYRLLFQNTTSGFALHEIITDDAGTPCDYRFLDVNPAFTKLTGRKAEDLVGHTVLEVLPGTEPYWIETYGKVALTGESVEFVHRSGVLGKDYEVLAYSPAPRQFAVVFHDITEQLRAGEEKRKLEEQIRQTQKMESLGVLAGGIAHDFNNLLMVVLGHAELALKEISPMSAARGSITEITTAACRATELCRQMLAYAGKSSFALERTGMRELVEEMAHLLKTAISKKAILNLNLERGLPPIEADPSQIRQVVMNLIINASEAIGDRSGVITVSVGATQCDDEYLRRTELHQDLAPGLYVHLEVADTGCGMDAGTRSRIFEPFFTTKFTGRGLGLAAVLGIVRAHKGALKVYSESGKGTTFKILFPALKEMEEEERPNEPSPLAEWRGKGTILLVDDEESLLALGGRMLGHLGFTILTAADGLQAVDLYRERGKEIELVLMDLTMPHMDGSEAFGELRRLNPDVRVVLTSGYSPEDVASRFAGKRLSGVLQKPYTLSTLRGMLAGIMPKRPDGEA
ncbi:MAG: ATP-binding protein [bacterium]|jgi:PAS domain S-box-containing protein